MSGEPKIKSEGLSRRDFLKESGIVIGGVTLVSLGIASACSPTKTSSIPPSDTKTATSDTTAQVTGPSDSTAPATVSVSSSVSITPGTSVDYSHYLPSSVAPKLLDIAGCTTKVAADRLYSLDLMWINTLTSDIGAIGLSDTFQLMIAFPHQIFLPKVGDKVIKDMPFGSIEGSKLNTDLISPVSGTVLDINDPILTLANSNSPLQPIIESPYTNGWLIVVQMSKPDELKGLMSATQFAAVVLSLE